MSKLLRTLLLAVVVVVIIGLVALHGFVRGIALLIVVAAVTTLPRTRVWKLIEGVLVRLTGSRSRAAALALIVVMGALAAYNLYTLAR